MSELSQRKKLLAAESEAYRGLLKAELRNAQIYSGCVVHKVKSVQTYIPLLIRLSSMARWLVSRRRRPPVWSRLAPLVLLGWQSYLRLGPAVRGLISKRPSSARSRFSDQEFTTRVE